MAFDPRDLQQRWNSMSLEEFRTVRRSDLREDVKPLYDLEVERRNALGESITPEVPPAGDDAAREADGWVLAARV